MKDNNERRLLMAVAISLAIVWLWSAVFGPKPTPEDQLAADGTAITAPVEGAAPAAVATPVPASGAPAPAVAEAPCTGATASIKSETSELTVSDCGAVRSVRLLGVPAAVSAHPWWSWGYGRLFGGESGSWSPYTEDEGELDLLSKGEFLTAGQGAFATGGTWTVTSTDPLVQQRTTSEGLRIIRTIRKNESADLWNVTVRFESDRTVNGQLWIGVEDEFTDGSRSSSNPGLLAVVDEDLEQLTSPTSLQEPKDLDAPVNWFGVADRFYMASAAPVDPGGAKLQWARVDDKRVGAFMTLAATSVGPGASVEQSFLVYAGPREVSRLEAAGHLFDKAGSLGFFGLFAKFLLVTLHLIHDRLGNWGYSILALTFLVRLVTYPLTRSAVVSGRKMQALQPELKKLQEQYAEDKEALNRETMALWSKNGVNPVGGCLPMLIQMPVFFALYSALAYEPSLFHADFYYLKDLSAQDPFGILGLFVMGGMYVQQLISPAPGMDPTQAQMMRLMPLVFGLMMFSAPAGLSLYYSLNTVLAIAQQWYNSRTLPPVIPPGAANVPA